MFGPPAWWGTEELKAVQPSVGLMLQTVVGLARLATSGQATFFWPRTQQARATPAGMTVTTPYSAW
jgi:hypothetical protein